MNNRFFSCFFYEKSQSKKKEKKTIGKVHKLIDTNFHLDLESCTCTTFRQAAAAAGSFNYIEDFITH